MSRQQVLQQVIAMMLVIVFLVGCGSPTATPVAEAPAATSTPKPPAATPTLIPPTPTPEPPTATPTPVPLTSTPTPSGPKAGHWEGEPSVSFDVTADSNINDFKMIAPILADKCTVELEEIVVETDGTFVFTNSSEVNQLDEHILDVMKSFGPKPLATKIASGDIIELQHISGKFDNATTLTGIYKILLCERLLNFKEEDVVWSAEWKGP